VEEQGRFSREAILTGLLKFYHEKYDFGLDLHHTLDLFVIGSIMSPCPQKSFITGLSWYEISPALFWA